MSAGAVVGLLMFGSLAVLRVERDAPDGNISTLGDAVWWSFTTMTTVGYGDHAPTTGLGRVLAVGLMLSGIALLGVVTANIAAWFIARFERDDAEERRQTAASASCQRRSGRCGRRSRRLSAADAGGRRPAPAPGLRAQHRPSPRSAGSSARAPAPVPLPAQRSQTLNALTRYGAGGTQVPPPG